MILCHTAIIITQVWMGPCAVASTICPHQDVWRSARCLPASPTLLLQMLHGVRFGDCLIPTNIRCNIRKVHFGLRFCQWVCLFALIFGAILKMFFFYAQKLELCDCISYSCIFRKEQHFLPILIAQSEKDMDFKVAITITNGPFKFETQLVQHKTT